MKTISIGLILCAVVLVDVVSAPQRELVDPPPPQWEWYPGVLVAPDEVDSVRPEGTITLPHTYRAEDGPSQFTLRRVFDLPQRDRPYAIKIHYMAAAYRVYVNGNEVVSTGSVEEPLRPQYLPTETYLPVTGGTTEVVIQSANDHHRRVRLAPIEIGPGHLIDDKTIRSVIKDAILFGSLLLLAAYHLLLFSQNRRDGSILVFAAIAGVSALRVGITTERILVRIWQSMPGELMMKIGYAPVFLLLPLFILYIEELDLFPSISRLRVPAMAALVGCSLLLAITPVSVYDAVFQYGLPVIVAAAIYVLVQVVRSRTSESLNAVLVLLVGAGIVLTGGVLDYFREIDRIQTPELLSVSILVFLLLQAYFLAHRFHRAYQRADALAGEIQVLNRGLERRIAERTNELAIANTRLEELSRTDVLTGLANRRFFNEAFQREWSHAVRDRRPLAIVMLDIDRFKRYNDRYGHLEGDRCLQKVGLVLSSMAQRSTDLAARFGGEEFIILLPNTSLEAAGVLAEEVRRRIVELGIEHDDSPESDVVTASVGYASVIPETGDSLQTLLTEVDNHLYTAKRNGRNRVAPDPGHPVPRSEEHSR